MKQQLKDVIADTELGITQDFLTRLVQHIEALEAELESMRQALDERNIRK